MLPLPTHHSLPCDLAGPFHSTHPANDHSSALRRGVPQSIVYDNTKLAVTKILGDGRSRRIRGFTELQSHYLFTDRFGRPGKGNDKGKVEGMVKFVRRNFLVPTPDKHPHKHKKPATYVSDLPVHAPTSRI